MATKLILNHPTLLILVYHSFPVVLCWLGGPTAREGLQSGPQGPVEGSVNSSHLQHHPGHRSLNGRVGDGWEAPWISDLGMAPRDRPEVVFLLP